MKKQVASENLTYVFSIKINKRSRNIYSAVRNQTMNNGWMWLLNLPSYNHHIIKTLRIIYPNKNKSELNWVWLIWSNKNLKLLKTLHCLFFRNVILLWSINSFCLNNLFANSSTLYDMYSSDFIICNNVLSNHSSLLFFILNVYK